MSRAIVVASGSTGVQAFTGPCTIVGVNVRESAGTPAAAKVTLHDGTSSAGAVAWRTQLAASDKVTVAVPALDCTTGIFVNRESGSTELVIYVL